MAYDSPTPKTNKGFLFDGATNFRVQTYRRVDDRLVRWTFLVPWERNVSWKLRWCVFCWVIHDVMESSKKKKMWQEGCKAERRS